jgi:hypothetical protein
MGNEYKAKLDGRKRVGRTNIHTYIQKKVAPPAPPNPVLGFTTLGHTAYWPPVPRVVNWPFLTVFMSFKKLY